MKKNYFLVLFILFLTNCGNKKENKATSYGKSTATEQKNTTSTTKVDSNSALISKGKELFKDKTCTTCHQVDKKVIGPSIKTITKIYKEKNANIIDFLQNRLNPIVDTDPGQIAVMKANLDGFVKQMTEDELKAIEAYMNSI